MEQKPVNKQNIKVGCISILVIFISLCVIIYVLLDIYIPDTSQTNQSQVTSDIQQDQNKPAFQILSYSMKNEQYAKYVTGKIQNNTNKTFSYVQVEINLYDINNNFLGSTMDNVNNFEPGAVWYFKAIVIDDNVKKFKIMNITWLDQ